MPAPFTPKQLRFVRKFAEPLFDGFAEMAISTDDVVRNFETQFTLIGASTTATVNMGKTLNKLRFVMNLFWGFEDASLAKRKQIIDKQMRRARIDEAQDAARLRAVIYGCYYGHWHGTPQPGDDSHGQDANEHNKVLEQIGFKLPKFRKRGDGEVAMVRLEGREIKPNHIVDPEDLAPAYDVIVIGSGSGGGVAAWNLAAKHKYSVLVIEAGPFVPSAAITHEERRMGATLFKHGTLQMTKDNDIVVFQGRNVGGSPTINNGICLRMSRDPLGNDTAPNPFEVWKDEFGIDLEGEFHDAYDQVRGHLGLKEADKRSGKGNGNHLFDAWNAFKQGRTERWIEQSDAGWFIKNYGPPTAWDTTPDTSCTYCGYCNTGCPYARKLAPGQTYLRWACDEGARILPETKVERILWAPTRSGGARHAIGVEAVVGPDQTPFTIAARVAVVVAAGTIASSKLLERSNIDDTGDGISLNVASPMIALMHDENASPAGLQGFHPAWDEDQMTTAVDCGDFLLESHFQPPQSMAMLMPGWFGEMDRRMRAYGRIRSAGILIPIDRRGKLKGEELELKFKGSDLALLRRALATLAKVHFAAGAKEVWPAIRTGEALIRPADDSLIDAYVDAFFARVVEEKDDVTLSSAHPHGGNPMHPDPDQGVVDTRCRLHAADNVLVTDASVFPSNIRVNAHYSTMALAQYATGGANPFA